MTVFGQRRLMFLITLIGAGFILFFPARQLVGQRDEVDALERRLAAVRAENQRLSQEASRLSDPQEVEVLARERLGLVRPGEQAYFVEPTQPPARVEQSVPTRSFWTNAWTWLRSLVRGRG